MKKNCVFRNGLSIPRTLPGRDRIAVHVAVGRVIVNAPLTRSYRPSAIPPRCRASAITSVTSRVKLANTTAASNQPAIETLHLLVARGKPLRAGLGGFRFVNLQSVEGAALVGRFHYQMARHAISSFPWSRTFAEISCDQVAGPIAVFEFEVADNILNREPVRGRQFVPRHKQAHSAPDGSGFD